MHRSAGTAPGFGKRQDQGIAEMSRGTTLLLTGDYEQAIQRLTVEAKQDSQDDFQVGRSYDLGIALILHGEMESAETHFRQLMEKAWRTVSGHRIWLGAIEWYRNRHSAAVQEWLQASKCAYQGSKGLDSAVALHFAAVMDSAVFDIGEAEDLLKRVLKRLDPQHYPAAIARFLLRDISRMEFYEQVSVSEGKFAKHWRSVQLSIAEFYLAIDSLRDGDGVGFATSLRTCAEATKTKAIYDEIVFARLECSWRDIQVSLTGAP